MRVSPVWLIGGAAAVLAAYAFTKIRRAGRLIFFPGAVHSFKFVGSIPVIEFIVSIQNTSSSPVQLNSIAGNLFSDKTLVGNLYTQQISSIPGNSSVHLRAVAQLSMIGIVNQLIAAFQNRDTSKEILFEGYANVDDYQVPIELKFNLGV